jgi:diguanylate cyclase (GGDEF)-like protein/PAS domain S-box-containing protein
MHRSQRTRHEAGALAAPTNPLSASSEGRVRRSTLVLLITRDQSLTDRLAQSLSEFAGDTLTIETVDRVSDATRRLKQNDGVDAVMMDWDLPATRGFETLLVLMGTAPELPIIILGDDPDLLEQMHLVEHGAQDYLLKRRLHADTLMGAVHSAIARKSRERILFCDKERAQVTLNSIGDAVLSTDANWRITFLNPVAEKLIGWTYAEASGQQLTEVFQVIDATTREPIVPCLEFEVGKGRTVVLPPNCVLLRRDGHELPIEDSAAPIHDRGGRVAGLVVVFHDVSEAQAMVQRITHLAEHDILTSLPNRGLLDDRLEQGVALAQRHSRRLAVLFIDLDHFKHINDSVGHLIGDQLLRAVALRIRPCVRSSDTVSRQGGDEFIVLLSEISDAEDAALIADKIRLAVLEPYTIVNHLLQLTASIGVSVYPEDGTDPESLIQCADTAMHYAKEKGRNRNQFFKEEMNLHAAERQIIRADLRHALDRREFVLEYQPKVNLSSGAITGVEALIRWRHPSRGVLAPLEFIQIAEDCGLIVQIGQWVLRAACKQAQTWLTSGVRFGTVAVNISAVEFRNDKFLEEVCGILESTGLDPRYLELELTETAVMRNFEATSGVLQSLSAMGIRIAVDDFGTGYSNLSYLKRFPINTLKLDKSFVHDIPENANIATIVRSVIHLGQSLHLNVVAEGVENAEQLKFLQAYDCAEGQGHYFSKPVDPTACQALISVGELRGAKQLSSPRCASSSSGEAAGL